MIPDNFWEWMFTPALIFIVAAFEIGAYFWPFVRDVAQTVLLLLIYLAIRRWS